MRYVGIAVFCAACVLASTDGLEQAEKFRRSQKFDQAVLAFLAEIRAEPNSAAARYGLVRSLLGAIRLDEARAAAEADLQRDPNSSLAFVAAGDVAFRMGEFSAAEKSYRQALRLNDKEARAWFGASEVLAVQSRFRTALRHLEKAFELAPNDPDILGAYAALPPRNGRRIELLERQLSIIDEDDPDLAGRIRVEISVERELAGKEPFSLASPYVSTVIKMEGLTPGSLGVGGLGLPVAINGAKPRLLLFDTGAKGITISRRAAAKMKLRNLAEADARGIGDGRRMSASQTIADSIQIGDLVFRNCPVTVTDKPPINEADGLIGADIFSDFRVTMDFPRSSLELESLPNRPGPEPRDAAPLKSIGGQMEFYRRGHLLLIAGRANQEPNGLFLVDTGANVPLLSDTLARRVGKPAESGGYGAKGLSGKVRRVYESRFVTLTFAGFQTTQDLILSFDLSRVSDSTGTEVAGILGREILRTLRFTIDYQNGTIRFQYQH